MKIFETHLYTGDSEIPINTFLSSDIFKHRFILVFPVTFAQQLITM